jgi:hypothetical protein
MEEADDDDDDGDGDDEFPRRVGSYFGSTERH